MVGHFPIRSAVALSMAVAAGCSPGAQSSLPQSLTLNPVAGVPLNGVLRRTVKREENRTAADQLETPSGTR